MPLNNHYIYIFNACSILKDWYSPDIEVVIKDSHSDSNLCGQLGVVRGVIPGHCSVYLHEEER